MKIYNHTILGAAASLILFASCQDVLDEQPRSSYDPTFFKTEKGVEGGITSLYTHLRYIYGNGYYYNACETGTDEATYAQSADANFKNHDMTDAGKLDATSCRNDVIWSQCFSNINTANGIIENGAAVNIAESLISEARFFRAYDYFLLVSTFGGVPLDLGGGELKFNTAPSRASVRNTVPEVYTKCIFPDLETAVQNLPDEPRMTGTVTKETARLFLAKAYLTYAWWLENPRNIPTYPLCDRVDPDGKSASDYFQKAYDMALEGINNPAGYGLCDYYYDVNLGSNDRNKEILLYADHTEDDEYYNASSLTYSGGGSADNFAGWMITWNYTSVKAYTDANRTSGVNPLIRTDNQSYGRPWTRMAPTQEVFKNTFTNRDIDSRYDGTFTTVFRANWDTNGKSWNAVYVTATDSVKLGEPIVSFLDEDDPSIVYPNDGGKNGVGFGEMPGRADAVCGPSAISRLKFPTVWKLGPYRTNTTGSGQPNAASTRPYNIAKFSEFYLIGAEAAVKGATGAQSARDLLNVLRARAGKWRYSRAGECEKIEDHSAEMEAATPETIDINYVLAERSRELYGEGYRWFDLVRTQTWEEIGGTYTICGSAASDHTPVTYTRTITPGMYLRPIPQGQLDAMVMSDEEIKNYQNPEYR